MNTYDPPIPILAETLQYNGGVGYIYFFVIKAVDTATCPRCHQPINSQAITCPYCRTQLKAYGHPGVPLHRAAKNTYLCDTCTYHADDTCNFPQRPYAKECTLYQNIEDSKQELQQRLTTQSLSTTLRNWIKRHQTLILLVSLLLICLVIVVSTP